MIASSLQSPLEMDHDDICLHLADPDPGMQDLGLREIRNRFERPLRAFVYRRLGISDDEDQDEILADTFYAVYRRARDGKTDLSQAPDQLVFSIARNKAVDLLRKRSRYLPTADAHEKAKADVLGANFADIEWNALARRGRAKEILDEFQKSVPELPERQGQVARAIALLFATNSDFTAANIRDAIEHITGTAPPLPSVKTAWEEVRKKLRDLMRKDL